MCLLRVEIFALKLKSSLIINSVTSAMGSLVAFSIGIQSISTNSLVVFIDPFKYFASETKNLA